MKVWHKIYDNLITLENIFLGFQEFKKQKKKTAELLLFEKNLEDNLFTIYKQLKNRKYKPGPYIGFYINDPKIRLIHKATFEDRIVQHIISRGLEKIFDPTFIYHSYACRKDKGTHRGVLNLQKMARKVSRNDTRPCYGLKCDIKKFFATVNHTILIKILEERITDKDYLTILRKIIKSFNSSEKNKGLPIGNLTSQYFVNIYMNEFDQFVKHTLKVKYYLRYTDDFMFLSNSKFYLEQLLEPISQFLDKKLDLELHPDKTKFLTFKSGFDFLGYVVFPHHILPRKKTIKRILRKIDRKIDLLKTGDLSFDSFSQTIQSYLGFLSHSNSYLLQTAIIDMLNKKLGNDAKIFRPLHAKKPKTKKLP